MNKLIDFKFKISKKEIRDFVEKETQLENLDFLIVEDFQQKLYELLNNSILSLSCSIDLEDNSIDVTPSLFNGKSIIQNDEVYLINNCIINE